MRYFITPFILLILLSLSKITLTQCNEPCATCSANSPTFCTGCIPQYVSVGNGICVPNTCQVPYCTICQIGNPTTCLACLSTFVLSNNQCVCQNGYMPLPYGSPGATCSCNSTACVSCPISGCLNCASGTSCSNCSSGYMMTQASGCLTCNQTNCQTCIINNYCMTCQPNNTVTLDGYCSICPSNCLVCYANSISCSQCLSGFSLSSTTKLSQIVFVCITCNIQYCLFCSATNFCKQCSSGYVANTTNGQCLIQTPPPSFPCTSYLNVNGINVCSSCVRAFFNSNPINRTCGICGIPNCVICSSPNASDCSACASGYYYSNGNVCVVVFAPNCLVFNSGKTQCITCNNYYTSVNGICYACTTPACISCSTNNTANCLSCQTGTYLQGGLCMPCLPYCYTCTNSTSCLLFSNSVIIANGQYAFTVCPSSCQGCSTQNPSACSNCNVGFYYYPYFSGGLCLPCNPTSNCQNCSQTNPSQCLTCLNQGFLVTINGTAICQYCTSPCSSCLISNLSSCTNCIIGYYLVGTQCIQNNCSPNCAYCSSNTTCLLCMSGYFPYQTTGQCLPGAQGCIQLSPNNPAQCFVCAPGYVLNPTTQACIQCGLNCLACASSALCLVCQPGYNLTTSSQTQCTPNCILPCASCQINNPSVCLSCIAGYTYNFNNNTCTPISNCLSCNVCPLGYSVTQSQTCIACGSTCASCYASNPSNCTGCMLGQWLNGPICSSCSANCASCINLNTCNYCTPGNYLSGWSLANGNSSINTCLPCQSPCFTCSNVSSLCQSCVSGYVLMGSQCLNIYNYQFNIVFNCTTNAFYQAYPTLVQNLLGTLGTQNQANLFPTAYQSNDILTLFSGTLSSQCANQNTACMNTQTSNLNALINSSSIAGLQVTSSTMTSSNGNIIQNCQPPCSTCTVPGGNICTNCLTGYTLVQSSCLPQSCPVPYCQSCLSGGVCAVCLPSFTLINNTCLCRSNFSPSSLTTSSTTYCRCAVGVNSTSSNATCSFCNIKNCYVCNINTCSACFPGYNLTSQGYSCAYCPSNCNLCVTSGYCSNCSAGLNVSTNGSCVLCNNVTVGCYQCSGNNICGYCDDGYTPYYINGTQTIAQCVICNVAYCSACNVTNMCVLCYSGYSTYNGTCVSITLSQLNCQLPCTQCGPSGQCLQCLMGMYSSIPNNGTCFMCMAANCFICTYSNPYNCTQCLQNYMVVQGNLGGYCQLISSYGCQNISSVNGSCLQCNSYFSLQNNGSCVQCSTGIQGCIACSSNLTTCTGCQSGMYLIDGYCMMCSVFCQTCNSTSCIIQNPQTYIVNFQGVITPCYMPCISCSSATPTICLACTTGYYLQNNTCIMCGASSSCKYCSGGVNQCQVCFNYQLMTVNITCKPCTSNCQSCSNTPSNCTSCINNYQLFNNTCVNQTVPSTSYCQSWTTNACSLCASGFVLMNVGNNCIASSTCQSPYYNCFPALVGCIIYAAGNPMVCEYCDVGLTLNPYNNSCMQCPQNCQNCSLDGVCSQCLAGYYLTANNITVCAPNCIYPCATCLFTNASICTRCVNGYYFSSSTSNQCVVNDIGCPCNTCPGGYGLTLSGSCTPCNYTLYCLNCARGNVNKCISCRNGYYLDNYFGCSSCPVNCSTCTSYTTCTLCAPGTYTPQSYNANSEVAYACLPCYFPCITCRVNAYQCLSCKKGYTLLGTQCLINFNYYFNVTLDATTSVFNQNYIAFVNQIINVFDWTATYINPRQFFPTQSQVINQNQNFIGGFIPSACTSGSTCAASEYLRLMNVFSSGVIGNMTVLNYFIQQTGALPYTNNSNTTKNQSTPIPTNFSCPSPCITCNTSSGVCLQCPSGYQIINGDCLLISCSVLYCQTCLNGSTTTCQQCNPTFILNNGICNCQQGFAPSQNNTSSSTCICQGSACITCTILNCLNCTQANFCTSCATPYQANSQGNCVLCNVNNCLNCQNSNYCTACAGGFSVSVNGDQCLMCNLPNCQYCSSITTCSVCQPGYFFDITGTSCITCNVPNCLTCQGNNACFTCASNYILNSNLTCVLSTCSYPCSSCNLTSTGTCLTCVSPPYQALPGPNGICFSCNVANCAICSFNSSTCTTCQVGFTLSSNSLQCISTCAYVGCTSCLSGQCVSCSSTYVLVSGNCAPCSSGCASCSSSNTSNCLVCIAGFYISNNTCSACPGYCSNCQSAQSCSQVQQQSTGQSQSLVQVNGQVYLASCDQGCQQCSSVNPSVCLQCQNGYYISQSICLPCSISSNCMTCLGSNSNQCITCYPNNYLTTSNGVNICSPCQSPCVTCQSSNLNACLSCPNGYLLQNSICLSSKCPIYCLSCTSPTNCLQCASGYASINGNCLPCLTGCAVCSVSSPGICLQCLQGTYLNPVNQQCVGCVIGCQTCLASGCTTCFSGYYLTSNLTCAPNCLFPCATCSFNNPSNCLSCQIGYVFNTSSIQNCQSDTSCSANQNCVSCPLGFVLTAQLQCQQCSPSCGRCVVGSASNCTSCASNRYLSGSSCVNCSSGCISCVSSSVCLQCASGYIAINSPAPNSPVFCAVCSFPCATCVKSQSNCLTCINGYSLQNAICISNFNYGFLIQLAVTSAQFYQNYQQFLSNLTSIVSGNVGYVNIFNINSGSVNVSGQLSTTSAPQSQESNTQYNNLQNSLAANSNFGGMQVISSSVNANGGNPQYTSTATTSSNWVIIVAIVVPIAVLLFVGIGVFIFLRRRKLAELELEIQIQQGGYELKSTLQ